MDQNPTKTAAQDRALSQIEEIRKARRMESQAEDMMGMTNPSDIYNPESTIKQDPEIPRQIMRLEDEQARTYDAVLDLMHRLQDILREPQPEGQAGFPTEDTVSHTIRTKIGAALEQNYEKAAATRALVRDILDRLEL